MMAHGAYHFGARPIRDRGTLYRYDVGWAKDGRLTALNTLSPRRLIPVGGQIYDLWDYLVREREDGDLFSPETWLFVIDPAFPAQPLALELTADFRLWEGKGTDRTSVDDTLCLVLLRSMKPCQRNVRANTQFLMVRTEVPAGFRSTYRLCFRALKTIGPGRLLHFDMGAFQHAYGWGDAATATAAEIKRRFQLGEECPPLPERVVEDRHQPWAYGFCPLGTGGLSPPRARVSREDLSYLTSGLPWICGAEEEEAIRSQRRGSGAPVSTSSAAAPPPIVSSVVMDIDKEPGTEADDEDDGGDLEGMSGVEGGTVRCQRGLKPGPIGAPPYTFATAYDPETLDLAPRYDRVPGGGFTWYDDPGDQRTSAVKRDWFAAYIAERRARKLGVTRVMTMRLQRYVKNSKRPLYKERGFRQGGCIGGRASTNAILEDGAPGADGGPSSTSGVGVGLDGGIADTTIAGTESLLAARDADAAPLGGTVDVAVFADPGRGELAADGALCVNASSATVAEVQTALQRVGGRLSAEQAAAMLDLLRGLER